MRNPARLPAATFDGGEKRMHQAQREAGTRRPIGEEAADGCEKVPASIYG